MNDELWEKLFGEKPEHHTVTVYNRENFAAIADSIKIGPDGPRVIEIFSGPHGKPVLPQELIDNNPKQILAMNFDDYPADVRFPDSQYQPLNPTITYKQAKEAVNFIKYGMDNKLDFIIHCDAGVSRSQQVAKYILLLGKGFYIYGGKSTHDHDVPQTIVLSRLLETYHSIYPCFVNKENKFVYNKRLKKWVFKKN